MKEKGFVHSVTLLDERIEDASVYPFTIPAVRGLSRLDLDSKITFLVGENGSGKSTLAEAIAVAAGFNAEGGTINFNFHTRRSESPLHRAIRLSRSIYKPRTGFFLRAESFFNVATDIERMDAEPSFGPPIIDSYGGKSLHEQSHGESFISLVKHRFGDDGFYVLDEPEAALSPSRQLSLLALIHKLILGRSQFVIATHSPILLAYPGAKIFELSGEGIRSVAYEDTESFRVTLDFLQHRESFLNALLNQPLDP